MIAPVVTTVHGPYSVNAYSKIMTRGQRVIAVSNMIRRYILDNYRGVDPSCIRVIHRGLHHKTPSRASPRFRIAFDFSSGPPGTTEHETHHHPADHPVERSAGRCQSWLN